MRSIANFIRILRGSFARDQPTRLVAGGLDPLARRPVRKSCASPLPIRPRRPSSRPPSSRGCDGSARDVRGRRVVDAPRRPRHAQLVQENPTVDEVVHLPAGITYWQTGSFRLYHHNPPLVKLVAALPVLLSGAAFRLSLNRLAVEPPNKAAFAHEFMQANAEQYFELFTPARLLMPVFSVVGGLVVFAWSRRLYGVWGGLLSLSLWTFCPNVLAHARLDHDGSSGATSLGVLATYVFWRDLKEPSWRRAALAGLAWDSHSFRSSAC